MSKIFWTQDEKELLTERAAQILRYEGERSRVRALNAAQEVLPENRRRPALVTVKQLDWYLSGVDACIERFVQDDKAEADAICAPEQIKIPAPEPIEPPPRAASVLAESVAQFVADVLTSPTFTNAVRSLASRYLGQPDPMHTQEFKATAAVMESGAEIKRMAERIAKRPKVLLVGLLGMQQEHIRQQFCRDLDLRFKGSDDTATEVRAAAKTVDHTIGMVGFMSHNQDKILKLASKDYRRVSNGVSSLKVVLDQLKPDPLH